MEKSFISPKLNHANAKAQPWLIFISCRSDETYSVLISAWYEKPERAHGYTVNGGLCTPQTLLTQMCLHIVWLKYKIVTIWLKCLGIPHIRCLSSSTFDLRRPHWWSCMCWSEFNTLLSSSMRLNYVWYTQIKAWTCSSLSCTGNKPFRNQNHWLLSLY